METYAKKINDIMENNSSSTSTLGIDSTGDIVSVLSPTEKANLIKERYCKLLDTLKEEILEYVNEDNVDITGIVLGYCRASEIRPDSIVTSYLIVASSPYIKELLHKSS